MPERAVTPAYIAAHIRRVLQDGGSAPHATDVQRFFKEEVKSRGWYTRELRKVAVRFRRSIEKEMGPEFLLAAADELFSGEILDEKNLAVMLLEKPVASYGEREFRIVEKWLDRVGSWADHDALVHYLIAPLMVADPRRAKHVFQWAKSRNRWRRRAACVALIRGARKAKFFPEIVRLSNALLDDEDDMVQKGLGWLLRETVKADPGKAVPHLMTIRARAPRLVLRTACETLGKSARDKVLASSGQLNRHVGADTKARRAKIQPLV